MKLICHKVINPSPTQQKKIVDALVEGCKDYRFHRQTCGDDPTLMRAQLECFVKAALIDCEIWTVSYEGPEIGCVAIWIPPGKSLREGPGKRELFDDLDKLVPPELKIWRERVLGKLRQEKDSKVKIDHEHDWHLPVITTIPSMRRRGLASALIDIVKAKTDQEGGTMSLTTQDWSSAEMYLQFGFEIVFEKTFDYLNGESDPYIVMKYESP